jgi:hypothetical protein
MFVVAEHLKVCRIEGASDGSACCSNWLRDESPEQCVGFSSGAGEREVRWNTYSQDMVKS